jgi:signal peptidase
MLFKVYSFFAGAGRCIEHRTMSQNVGLFFLSCFGAFCVEVQMKTESVWKVWDVLTWLLTAAAIVLALALAGARLFGLEPFAVLSGSMEPLYPAGSIVYVREENVQTLQEGDVITYLLDEDTVVTHRIEEVIVDEDGISRFKTKGDANDAADGSLVRQENVLGSPALCIPYLGYLAAAFMADKGIYLILAVAAGLALLIFLPEFWKELTEKEKQK